MKRLAYQDLVTDEHPHQIQNRRRGVRSIRRRTELVIALLFLGYGLLRLFVGLGLLGQSPGLIDIEAFHEPIKATGAFLEARRAAALVPFSVPAYMVYIALMGATLILGAIGVFRDKAEGLMLLGAFLALYVALFVNFQTINRKIVHLGVAAVLFSMLVALRRRRLRPSEPSA